jgi:hypothetical protein
VREWSRSTSDGNLITDFAVNARFLSLNNSLPDKDEQ